MNFIVLECHQFETQIFPSASHTVTYLESMDLFEHWVRLQNQSHGFKASFPQYVSAIWRAFPVFFDKPKSIFSLVKPC